MILSDQTLSSKLPTRKLTKKLTVDDTNQPPQQVGDKTRCNKLATKYAATGRRKKHEKQLLTQIDVEETTLLEKKIHIWRRKGWKR